VSIVFLERRDPADVVPWLFVLVFFPVVGFVLYMIFGFQYFKQKQFRLKAHGDRRILDKVIAEQKLGIEVEKTRLKQPELDPFLDLARMLLVDNASFLTSQNEVEVFIDGERKFDALFEAIKNAKDHVHMEYYIIRNDELGRKLIAALVQKAKEGVEVRFLYDDLGNKMPKKYYRTLVSAGGKVSGFYKTLIPGLSLRVNYRNHRKIAIIDGTTGFLGGFNVGEEYLGRGPLGYWRDTAVRIRGDGVKALQLRFVLDWNYATKEGLSPNPKYMPPVELKGGSGAEVQIVNSGPDTVWEPTKAQYLKMVNIAKKTVYLQTPYFIPDQSLLEALRMAALSGVDVRIMIPCKPDHPLVYWAGLSYVGQLLDAGVRAYNYNNGFIHAKTLTVDDIASSIGTANWDIRSFKWNFESNAIVYDKEFAARQRLIFEDDIKQSTEITKESYAKRSSWIRIRESVSRLFSAAL